MRTSSDWVVVVFCLIIKFLFHDEFDRQKQCGCENKYISFEQDNEQEHRSWKVISAVILDKITWNSIKYLWKCLIVKLSTYLETDILQAKFVAFCVLYSKIWWIMTVVLLWFQQGDRGVQPSRDDARCLQRRLRELEQWGGPRKNPTHGIRYSGESLL